MLKEKVAKHFNSAAKNVDINYRNYFAGRTRRALKIKSKERDIAFNMLSDKKGIAGKKILDAGCGFGGFTKRLVENNADVISIDLSMEMIKECQKELNTLLCVADIECPPFKEESFDAIVCIDVLQYFTKGARLAALDSLIGLIAPGGKIIVSIRNSWSPFLWFGWKKSNPVGETTNIFGILRKFKEHELCNIQKRGVFPFSFISPIVVVKGQKKSIQRQ